MAFCSRAELAEATALIMIKGGYDKEIVLFTPRKAYTFKDMVNILNETTGRNVKIHLVSEEDYVRLAVEHDKGGKSEAFFQTRLSWFHGVSIDKDGETIDPLMEELLGRQPKDTKQIMEELLHANPDYTWHQNYTRKY